MNNKILFSIIAVAFVGGMFTVAYAGPMLPMITLAGDTHTTGDADIDGNLNVDGQITNTAMASQTNAINKHAFFISHFGGSFVGPGFPPNCDSGVTSLTTPAEEIEISTDISAPVPDGKFVMYEGQVSGEIENSGDVTAAGADPFIAEVTLFAGNFAPRGWAFTHGQLLSISQNTALFSLVGTMYGGDGRITFGLPDTRCLEPAAINYIIALVGVFPSRN